MGIPGFREAIYLVSKGVPYDTAMRMAPARRMAHVIALMELNGRRWNWSAGRWEETK